MSDNLLLRIDAIALGLSAITKALSRQPDIDAIQFKADIAEMMQRYVADDPSSVPLADMRDLLLMSVDRRNA